MKRRLYFLVVAILALSLTAFAGTTGEKKVDIKIEGMTCAGCVSKVQGSLQKVDGVTDAKVKLEGNNAVVVYDSEKTDEKALHKAINATGFKAVAGGDKTIDKKACPTDCGGECCATKDANKKT